MPLRTPPLTTLSLQRDQSINTENAVVAVWTDGAPLDLIMTKVDLAKGQWGQNVYYRMQVVHEKNQDNFWLFTKW